MSHQLINTNFSSNAFQYDKYNIIQKIVSKSLIRDITSKPKNIVDIGCGSGQNYSNISWDFDTFYGIDFSKQMCELHFKSQKVSVDCVNFDETNLCELFDNRKIDMIISSSALQWSKNLDNILNCVSNATKAINMSLFTANTFKTMHEIIDIKSPILDIKTIKDTFSKYFECEFEVLSYFLEFEDKKTMFDYIKKSGVGSSSKKLDFKTAKYLYKNYKLNYLEFEVIYIKGLSRK